jgi:glutaredoxin
MRRERPGLGTWPRWFTLLLLVSLVCCQAAANGSGSEGIAPAPAAETPELPPLRLLDETPNLLLTWIGEDGDFHVVERIDAVPSDRREQVRVVLTDQAEGRGSSVYIADLRNKRPDGTYAVTTLARVEWEKLGAQRRKVRIEALAPAAAAAAQPTEGGAEAAPGATPAPNPAAPGAAISAIIYGADWCKPCHDAERYLKSLGVTVTKKDIEESRAARAEMQEKLARVNRAGAGIPVIDVMGKIFVGYSPDSLKQAVDTAKREASSRHG